MADNLKGAGERQQTPWIGEMTPEVRRLWSERYQAISSFQEAQARIAKIHADLVAQGVNVFCW